MFITQADGRVHTDARTETDWINDGRLPRLTLLWLTSRNVTGRDVSGQ